MSEAETQAVATKPTLRWYQFSLRSLLLIVTLFAIIAALGSTVAWWRTRYPSQVRCWNNHSSGIGGSLPHFYVWAKSINLGMPTIACFARIDDPKRVNAPMPWLKSDFDSQVFIEGRYIPHRPGTLQLFLDQGDGRPVLIILEPDDANRYFDQGNTYFTTYQAFVDFWEKVLKQKYLRGVPDSPRPDETKGASVSEVTSRPEMHSAQRTLGAANTPQPQSGSPPGSPGSGTRQSDR